MSTSLLAGPSAIASDSAAPLTHEALSSLEQSPGAKLPATRRAASAGPAIPAKDAENLIGTPSESGRSNGNGSASPSPSASSADHESVQNDPDTRAREGRGAGAHHNAGLEISIMMDPASVLVHDNDDDDDKNNNKADGGFSAMGKRPLDPREQTKKKGGYQPWKSAEMNPPSAGGPVARPPEDTGANPKAGTAQVTPADQDDEADADGAAEINFIDAEFADDDDPNDEDYNPGNDDGDSEDDEDDEDDEDADEEDSGEDDGDEVDEDGQASGPDGLENVTRITEIIAICDEAGPGSGSTSTSDSCTASSVSHEANYSSQPMSATVHLWTRDSKLGHLRDEALAHERAQSGYGGGGREASRGRSATFDLHNDLGVTGVAGDGFVRHLRAAAAAMESDSPLVSDALSPFSNGGSFRPRMEAGKKAAAAAAAATIDKAESAAPTCLPANHRVVTDIGELGQYLASASYIVSLGGRPLEDLKYGVIIVPEGEEEVLFGGIPGKGEAGSVASDMFREEVAEKSAKAKKALHEQQYAEQGAMDKGNSQVVPGHNLGEKELEELDDVLREMQVEEAMREMAEEYEEDENEDQDEDV